MRLEVVGVRRERSVGKLDDVAGRITIVPGATKRDGEDVYSCEHSSSMRLAPS